MRQDIPNVVVNDHLSLPLIGFGTFQIAAEQTAQVVGQALEAGYRHIDTAEVYANEEGVGLAIREALKSGLTTRESLRVTTKLWPGFTGCGEVAKSYSQTLAAFDRSLNKLGLDYIDLYLIHSPHGMEERLAQWEALVALQQQGRVKAIGVSNYNINHIDEIREAGLTLPEINQIELHPWSQKPQLVAYLRQHGILPMAYSSLAPLANWRSSPTDSSAKNSADRHSDHLLAEIAQRHGVSEAKLLLRWATQQGIPALAKSLNPQRMAQNLAIFDFTLSDQDFQAIKDLDRGAGIAWEIGDPSLLN